MAYLEGSGETEARLQSIRLELGKALEVAVIGAQATSAAL